MSFTRVLAAAALCCAALVPSLPAGAAPAKVEPTEHCVLTAVGQRASGEYLTTQKCYSTFSAAMAAVGVDTTAADPTQLDFAALDDDITIATHFDYWNLGGGTFSVVGVTCAGGYLNLPSNWRNRVSSTLSSVCSQITHWDQPDKAGSLENTYPSGNLSTMNNKAESIQYL